MGTIAPDIRVANGAPQIRFGDRLGEAFDDLWGGIVRLRVALLLAVTDIRNRYRRSKFGQWWLTLSMGITVGTLAFVYATLFSIELAHYLPHVAVSLVAWALLSSIVIEGGGVFLEAEHYLKNVRLPLSVFLFRVLIRNLIVYAHNFVLVPVVMLAFGIMPTVHLLWLPISLLLVMLNGVWVVAFLGTLSARFRDLPQILGNGMQVLFFLSPVIWKPSQLSETLPWLNTFNPFAAFLALLRDPIFGHTPPLEAWLLAIAVTIGGFVLAVPFFAAFRGRVVYYL